MGLTILNMIARSRETEYGYARRSNKDKDGEYSYIITECDNAWYSVKTDPMLRNNCLCPKCGRRVMVVIPGVPYKL